MIRYTDGKEPVENLGHTFKFVGNPSDLHDGRFELRREAAVEKLDAKMSSV